jgi:hypothetical protein
MAQRNRDSEPDRPAEPPRDPSREQTARKATDVDRLRGADLAGDDPEGDSCVVIHHRDEKESDS